MGAEHNAELRRRAQRVADELKATLNRLAELQRARRATLLRRMFIRAGFVLTALALSLLPACGSASSFDEVVDGSFVVVDQKDVPIMRIGDDGTHRGVYLYNSKGNLVSNLSIGQYGGGTIAIHDGQQAGYPVDNDVIGLAQSVKLEGAFWANADKNMYALINRNGLQMFGTTKNGKPVAILGYAEGGAGGGLDIQTDATQGNVLKARVLPGLGNVGMLGVYPMGGPQPVATPQFLQGFHR